MLILYFLLGLAVATAHSDYGVLFRAQNFEKTVKNINILNHQRQKRFMTGYFVPQNQTTNHQTWGNVNITRNNTFCAPPFNNREFVSNITGFKQNGTLPSNNNARVIYPGQPGYVASSNNTSGSTGAMTNVSTQNYVNPGQNYNINLTRPGFPYYSNINVMPVNKNNNTLNPVTPGYMPYPGYNTGYPGYAAPNANYHKPNTSYQGPNTLSPASNVYPAPNNGYTVPNNGYAVPNNGYAVPNNGYSVPNNGYAVPPNNGYAVPNNGYAVPNNGYAVPNNGYAVPNNGYAVPNNGYAVPNNGYVVPPNNGYAVPNNGYAIPPNNGYAVPNNGYAVPNNGYTVPNNGYAVPNNGYVVPNNGYAVPNNGYTVPNNGYAVPNNGYAVPNNGYAVPNNGYAVPNNGYSVPNTGVNTTASLADCKCSLPRANSTITKEERTMDACMISCNNCPTGMRMSSYGMCVKDEDDDY